MGRLLVAKPLSVALASGTVSHRERSSVDSKILASVTVAAAFAVARPASAATDPRPQVDGEMIATTND
jgi:hypothetical protein